MPGLNFRKIGSNLRIEENIDLILVVGDNNEVDSIDIADSEGRVVFNPNHFVADNSTQPQFGQFTRESKNGQPSRVRITIKPSLPAPPPPPPGGGPAPAPAAGGDGTLTITVNPKTDGDPSQNLNTPATYVPPAL